MKYIGTAVHPFTRLGELGSGHCLVFDNAFDRLGEPAAHVCCFSPASFARLCLCPSARAAFMGVYLLAGRVAEIAYPQFGRGSHRPAGTGCNQHSGGQEDRSDDVTQSDPRAQKDHPLDGSSICGRLWVYGACAGG